MHNSVCVFVKSLSSLFISANFCLRDVQWAKRLEAEREPAAGQRRARQAPALCRPQRYGFN